MSDDESAVSPVGQTWHSDLVGQPHSAAEEKVAEAEAVAARISTEDVPSEQCRGRDEPDELRPGCEINCCHYDSSQAVLA